MARRLGSTRMPLVVLAALILSWPCPAKAHESDQFTLPAGRPFADLGDYLNRWAYETIRRGVDQTNARIRAAVENDASQQRLNAVQSPGTVTVAVTRSFPNAFKVIEDLNWMAQSRAMQRRYPGALVGYKRQFTNAYQNVHFILDPRQLFRIWHSATIKAYGTYLGTDKIGHFTDMGRHYYHAYAEAKQRGATESQAIERAVAVGNEGLFFAEEGALGYLTAGAYSNADMAANYLGLQFYRNLTEPVSLKGETQPPMLEKAGEYWRIADHVAPDSDFFRIFISAHLNEALNPSHFEEGMRDAIRKAVRQRRAMVLWRYRDAHGQRRPPQWFEEKASELRTYYGRDYGHRGPRDELITIADACFERFDADAPLDARTDAGYTPLHMAVLYNDMTRVKELLDRGAPIESRVEATAPTNPADGATALHLAARDGRAPLVKLLIERGASVNATSTLDQTPLHKSAGHRAVMEQLLQAGADVSARDARHRTPLHWAAYDPSANLIPLLLDHGAAIDARDKHDHTPLHRAADAGRASIAQTLLDRGAAPNPRADLGLTPMHLAAGNNQPQVIYQLALHGADVDAQDNAGWRPLHDAAHRGQIEAVDALLEAGADPNAGDIYGTTPLHLACRGQKRATAMMLIDQGASVKASNQRGLTPLHEAAFAGESTLVRTLVEAGAAPRVTDDRGRTPRNLARAQSNKNAAAVLADMNDKKP